MAKSIATPTVLEEISSGVLPPLPVELGRQGAIPVVLDAAPEKPVPVKIDGSNLPNQWQVIGGFVVLIIVQYLTRIVRL